MEEKLLRINLNKQTHCLSKISVRELKYRKFFFPHNYIFQKQERFGQILNKKFLVHSKVSVSNIKFNQMLDIKTSSNINVNFNLFEI